MPNHFVSQEAHLSTLLHFIDTDRSDPRVIVAKVTSRAELEAEEVFAAFKASISDWVQNSGEGRECHFNADGNVSMNRLIEADLDTPAFRRSLGRNRLERIEILACFGLLSCKDATASLCREQE